MLRENFSTSNSAAPNNRVANCAPTSYEVQSNQQIAADESAIAIPPDATPPVASNSTHPRDPFEDLDKLRISQDFAADANVTPALSTIAVCKPNRQDFVRVRPGNEWRLTTWIFVHNDTGETYIVADELSSHLVGEIKPAMVVVAISRHSLVPFLWPLPIPGDGTPNRWHESGIEAARLAESAWVRVASDKSSGSYLPHIAKGDLPEPKWPAMSFKELLRLAFSQRFISDLNHPVLRQLRGEI